MNECRDCAKRELSPDTIPLHQQLVLVPHQLSNTPSEETRRVSNTQKRRLWDRTRIQGRAALCMQSDLDITDRSKNTLPNGFWSQHKALLKTHYFATIGLRPLVEKIHNENETMILRDICRAIVPSAKKLATCGATGLDHLLESSQRRLEQCYSDHQSLSTTRLFLCGIWPFRIYWRSVEIWG